jgi:glycosyltransferase involved in cell wall biosynthesis
MKLLVVTQYFWPENFRINDLVAEMVRRGHKVTVLTGIPNYPEGKVDLKFRDNPAAFSEYAGARVVRVPMAARGSGTLPLLWNYITFLLSASIAGPWKLRGERYDVLFVCQFSPVTSALPGVLLRWLKRIPMAMWVLDLWPETLAAVGVVRSKRVLAVVGLFVSFIYRQCDLILAQSRSFVPVIQTQAGQPKRVKYFPSWAEAIFDSEAIDAAPEVPAAPKSFSVMFAGNIGDAQDFPTILNAAEILRDQDIRWLIVGDGRAAAWVAEEVKRRQLSDRVLLLGRYPLSRMPAFFRHADALLVSLKDEPIFALTIPGKMQTYLATGIPLLAMLNGEGAQVVAESGAGLASPSGNADQLAQSVLVLSRMSTEQLAEMGTRGLVTYKREFERGKLMDWLENELIGLSSSYQS